MLLACSFALAVQCKAPTCAAKGLQDWWSSRIFCGRLARWAVHGRSVPLEIIAS